MTEYIKESISKEELSDAAVNNVLLRRDTLSGRRSPAELTHGEWIRQARKKLKKLL